MEKPSPRKLNGPAILVAMFRAMDAPSRQKFLGKLRGKMPVLAQLVDEFSFIYIDLMRLEDASVQKLIGLVAEKEWLLAWKLSDDGIRALLLKNMSVDRRKDFVHLATIEPRAPRKQVVKIQAHIAHKALRLLERGELRLRSLPRRKVKSDP